MQTRPITAVMLLSLAVAGIAALAAEATPSLPPLFVQKCVKCHGEDGRAQTPKGKKMKARDFTDPDFQQHKSDEQIVDTITNGTDKDMPAFGKILTPEQIESLRMVVRSFGR